MTGWFALALIVAMVIATAAIFAAGRKAGTAAEAANAREAELKSQKEASDAKSRMLEAGASAPRDRDALADCLREAPFGPYIVCPPVAAYDRPLQTRLADEIQRLPPGAALELAMLDYARLRDQARACAGAIGTSQR